jgi:hypothetical protein
MQSHAEHVSLTDELPTANGVMHAAHRFGRHVQNCAPAVTADLLGYATRKATQAPRVPSVQGSQFTGNY